MFNNLSASINNSSINYPIADSNLAFSDYIALTRAIIEERRADNAIPHHPDFVVDANSPFELYPENPKRSGNRLKYGALLIHGLLDCPFSLKDIGLRLQSNGILTRAILLPGHGTSPGDLLQVSYHDWLLAVRYGVETLRREVEQIFLIGYSTGAALSIYQALQDSHISGVILLSPAIRIKAPVDIVVGWHSLVKTLSRTSTQWIYNEAEIDYAKYKSIAFNPVSQVSKLTRVIHDLRQHHTLNAPMFMVVSHEDETISSHRAIDFFSNMPNEESKLLLYTSFDHQYPDPRILSRQSHFPDLGIKHLSHASIPFAPTNPHYGQQGDYAYASHTNMKEITYGAYNRIEERWYHMLYQLGMTQKKRRELTYNPDFEFMAEKIVNFVLAKENSSST